MKSLVSFDLQSRHDSAHPERDATRLIELALHQDRHNRSDSDKIKYVFTKRTKALLATLSWTVAGQAFKDICLHPRRQGPTSERWFVTICCSSSGTSPTSKNAHEGLHHDFLKTQRSLCL